MSQTTLSAQWAEKLKPLVGRTIVGVRYLDASETVLLGIANQPVCLELDDGALLWRQAIRLTSPFQSPMTTPYCPATLYLPPIFGYRLRRYNRITSAERSPAKA